MAQRADLGAKRPPRVPGPCDASPGLSAVRGRLERRPAAGTPEQIAVPRHRIDTPSRWRDDHVPIVACGGPDMADVGLAGNQVARRAGGDNGIRVDQPLVEVRPRRGEAQGEPGCAAVGADVDLGATQDVAGEVDAALSIGHQSRVPHRPTGQRHWRKGPALVGRHVQRVPIGRKRGVMWPRVGNEQGAVDRVEVVNAQVDRRDRFESPSAVDTSPERRVEARRLPRDPEHANVVHGHPDDEVHRRHTRHVREVGFLEEPRSVD